MRIDIITIFPHIFDSYFCESIIKRAQAKKLLDIRVHNLRDFTHDKHHKVHDSPYGGGAGMVLKAEPIIRAVDAIRKRAKGKPKVVVFSAKGEQYTQQMAVEWVKKYRRIVCISGRYEGMDERVMKALGAEEISIGPYVLTDGDAAAMVMVSSLVRLIPGAIKFESLQEESHWSALLKKKKGSGKTPARTHRFGTGGLEYPHYTRPEVFAYREKKYAVPRVLLGGNHKKIDEWRKKHQK